MAGSLAVTKFEAARRQLNAAIVMYFRNDDTLAVHCVGHAAFRLMREILKKRGTTDLHMDLVTRGLYEFLRAYRMGLLGPSAQAFSGLENLIRQIPEDMWQQIESNEYEDVEISLTGHDARAFWKAFADSYNFLKHDHASLESIDETDLENERLLSYAIAAYGELGFAPTLEMLTFFAYWFSIQPYDVAPPQILQKKVDVLRR